MGRGDIEDMWEWLCEPARARSFNAMHRVAIRDRRIPRDVAMSEPLAVAMRGQLPAIGASARRAGSDSGQSDDGGAVDDPNIDDHTLLMQTIRITLEHGKALHADGRHHAAAAEFTDAIEALREVADPPPASTAGLLATFHGFRACTLWDLAVAGRPARDEEDGEDEEDDEDAAAEADADASATVALALADAREALAAQATVGLDEAKAGRLTTLVDAAKQRQPERAGPPGGPPAAATVAPAGGGSGPPATVPWRGPLVDDDEEPRFDYTLLRALDELLLERGVDSGRRGRPASSQGGGRDAVDGRASESGPAPPLRQRRGGGGVAGAADASAAAEAHLDQWLPVGTGGTPQRGRSHRGRSRGRGGTGRGDRRRRGRGVGGGGGGRRGGDRGGGGATPWVTVALAHPATMALARQQRPQQTHRSRVVTSSASWVPPSRRAG